MHKCILVVLSLVAFLILIEDASAQVYILDNEFKAYFNSEGLYTVVGVINSDEDTHIKPIINIEIEDGSNIIKKRIEWVPIVNPPTLVPHIPFKIVIPEVKSSNPIIKSINVEFEAIDREPIPVMAVYDDTLKIHDNYVTGRAINIGNKPVENVKLYAVAKNEHGELLDVGISIETLDLKPNEMKEFTMYIDPIFKGKAVSYSCFAPSDPLVLNLTTTRYEKPFEVYAESTLWLYNPRFDEDNNILYFNATNNSIPLPIRIPLTLPLSSMDERLKIYLDGKEVDAFQTLAEDEMHWHLSFDYPGASYIKEIKITNFKEAEYEYIKLDAKNMTVILQLPKEIVPMRENIIKLAFTNSTTAEIIRDVNYNIKLVKDDKVLLDENRNAIRGIDILSYTFDKEGEAKIEIEVFNEELRSNIESSIAVVPEFPISMLIITISMLSMIAILRYKQLKY